MVKYYRTSRDTGGSANADVLWVIAIIAAFWLVWYATGGPSRPQATSGPFISPPGAPRAALYSSSGLGPSADTAELDPDSDLVADQNLSPWHGQVRISAGNARYENRPGKEYVEILANYNLSTPVTISGWFLANGKIRRVDNSTALISSATESLTPNGSGNMVPVVLEPGSRAAIITGDLPNRTDWPFQSSFRINKCVGYLMEEFETLNITPSLPYECPRPGDEPGVDSLPDKCYNFVRRLSSCHEPEFKEDRDGVRRVDGRVDDLTRECRLYVQDHFSYNGCLKWHKQDPDFYGNDWRIFLGRRWEMWAENREVITLYDREGKFVDQIEY